MTALAKLVAVDPSRFAAIDRDVSYLRTPLHWRLRIYGQGVGGYAPAEGSVSRYADKHRAEAVAEIWMERGIYPANQTTDDIDTKLRSLNGARVKGV